jgi:hypothetical protein
MHRHRLAGPLLIALIGAMAMPAAAGQAPPALQGTRVNVLTVVQGNALTSTNAALPNALIRLRNARTGQIVGTTRTDRSGLFMFRPVDPGSYIVELIDDNKRVLAASEILNVNAGDVASAIVKLPFRLQPYAGVLGHTAASALLVTATAAASGVLASQVAGEPVSPRR